MAWTDKNKVNQQGDDQPIVTPDGFQILVGENEDKILMWQLMFNNWTDKSKQAQVWGLKNKTPEDWNLKPKIVS